MSLPIPNSGIMEITPYRGGDITPEGMVREVVLSSNENPYPPAESVQKAIIDHVGRLNSYPKGATPELKNALGAHFGLNPQKILVSNGSESILHLIGRVYLRPGLEAILPECGFPIYKIITQACGAKPVLFPQPSLKVEVAHVLKEVTDKTGVIFLDNPANPLGTYLPKEGLVRILEKVPSNVLVVHDGAYAEYMADVEDYTSGLDLVDLYPNLIVTRTFSKMYALAGIRLGWSYASQESVDTLSRVREPFSVSSLAQVAGVAALAEGEWAHKIRRETIELRQQFIQNLRTMGIGVQDSVTNFALVPFGERTQEVYQFLGKNGVIVRPMGGKIQNYLRISIGSAPQMEKAFKLLHEVW